MKKKYSVTHTATIRMEVANDCGAGHATIKGYEALQDVLESLVGIDGNVTIKFEECKPCTSNSLLAKYVIECGGKPWNDRFACSRESSLPWGEWDRSALSSARSFTKEEAEAVIAKQGFGEAVLRSSFGHRPWEGS